MIEYVNINGVEWPIRISYVVLNQVKSKHGVSLESLGSNMEDLTIWETVLFYGLRQGCKAEEKEFTWKENDMEDALDACFMELISKVPLFFQKGSQVSPVPVQKTQTRQISKKRKK
jgi:hypothetical protein